MHDVFHVSILKQNNTKKGQNFSVPEFETGNVKEYKMEVIQDSTVYIKEANGHLPRLYYLVALKSYLEEKNIRKPFLAIMHF